MGGRLKERELVGVEKGPGTTEKQLSRTREGIRIEAALRVFTELVSQTARQSRMQDAMAPALAEKAFKCADAFVKVWDSL